MAIDATTFVANFPEFAEINTTLPTLVPVALLRAQAFCSQTMFGDRYQDAVFQKCAHLIAMGAFGENARIDAKAATAYGEVFKEMVRALPVRLMVSGGFGPGYTPWGA